MLQALTKVNKFPRYPNNKPVKIPCKEKTAAINRFEEIYILYKFAVGFLFYNQKMAIIKKLNGIEPKFGKNCFVADNASVIGRVEMGDDCSIWFGAVLRGDVHDIKMGNKVNVQDNATIHATYEKSPTRIGNNVSIAHNAVVHGCTIHDNVLIGMGAVVLDDAVVRSNSIVAAGSVVTKGTIVESGWIYAGTPAKKLKKADPETLKNEVERIANAYTVYADWYKQ